MNNKTSVPIVNHGLSMPFGFNLPGNKFQVDIFAQSEFSRCRICLYEYHGVYWYSVDCGLVCMNSCGFVGMRNCVYSMRDTLSSLGFVVDDFLSLCRFVDFHERGLDRGKVVA